MFVCDCGRTPPEGYEYCGCGQPVPHVNDESIGSDYAITMGDNTGGIQAGRDFIADRVIVGKDPSDPFDLRMPIERTSKKKSVLPDNWLAAVAAVCTILSFVISAILPPSIRSGWFLPLTVFGLLGGFMLLGWAYFRLVFMPGQVIVSPFGTYEKSYDGTVYATQVKGECPWCSSNGRHSRMSLRSIEKVPMWVCDEFPAHHSAPFDPSTVEPL
ncbi:hypothetical protein [Paenarthrobacter sp. FR1]|uniref:hypothetical protein n=1 Tax=Paenarthrobacter sp. FR1 TaxID=3439548 RepID=UPI003DA680A1